MILGTECNLQLLTGGLRLKVRIQHPSIHERTDRGGSYWFFRFWDDALQADGTMKPVRRFHVIGPSQGENRLSKKKAEVERHVGIGHAACATDLELDRDLAVQVRQALQLLFVAVTHLALGRSEEHTSELQSLRHLVCR